MTRHYNYAGLVCASTNIQGQDALGLRYPSSLMSGLANEDVKAAALFK